jgi:hypothetical protein
MNIRRPVQRFRQSRITGHLRWMVPVFPSFGVDYHLEKDLA